MADSCREVRLSGSSWRVGSVLAAVGCPLAVALVFPHPVARPMIPDAVIVALAMLMTVRFGPVRGVLSVVSGTVSLWYFNFPPGYSFRLTNGEDAAALVAAGAVGLLLVGALSVALAHERRAVEEVTRTEDDLSRQRQTIIMMQDLLLPVTWQSPVGLTLGWHYRAGGGPSAPVGGDWLVFVPISECRVGIAVGDVCGSGLVAVRHMAQYRFALKTLAVQSTRPAEVLTRVDEVAEFYGISHFSTALYGVIDTRNATWTFSSAGHPPPLLLRGGTVEALGFAHGPPLGSNLRRKPFEQTEVKLVSGDVLVLFTDGVVERRGEGIDVGIDRLRNVLTTINTGGDLNEIARSTITDLAGDQPSDDTAIVIAHFAT